MRPYPKELLTRGGPPKERLVEGDHPFCPYLGPGHLLSYGIKVPIYCHPTHKEEVYQQEDRGITYISGR